MMNCSLSHHIWSQCNCQMLNVFNLKKVRNVPSIWYQISIAILFCWKREMRMQTDTGFAFSFNTVSDIFQISVHLNQLSLVRNCFFLTDILIDGHMFFRVSWLFYMVLNAYLSLFFYRTFVPHFVHIAWSLLCLIMCGVFCFDFCTCCDQDCECRSVLVQKQRVWPYTIYRKINTLVVKW